jgi:hypothetical protein
MGTLDWVRASGTEPADITAFPFRYTRARETIARGSRARYCDALDQPRDAP